MDFLRKIAGFFPGRENKEIPFGLSVFREKYPALPLGILTAPALHFYFLATGALPSSGELSSLRGELLGECGETEGGKLFLRAKDGAGNSEETMRCAEKISTVALVGRLDFLHYLLNFFPACSPLSDTASVELENFAKECGIPQNDVTRFLENDRNARKEKEALRNSGTGLAAALIVILVFVLAAAFLKTVFFGFLLAYLFLPLERFFEKSVFRTHVYCRIEKILLFPFLPFRKLKHALTKNFSGASAGHCEDCANEKEKRERTLLSSKASAAAILSLILCGLVFAGAIVTLLAPFAVRTGKSFAQWASDKGVFRNAETTVEEMLNKKEPPPSEWLRTTPGQTTETAARPAVEHAGDAPAAATGTGTNHDSVSALTETDDSEGILPHDTRSKLRDLIKKLLSENLTAVAGAILGGSGDVAATVLNFAGALGAFALDLLLCFFFFFVFLQQMAYYTNPREGNSKESVGSWTVGGLFNTAWFPLTNPETRAAAAEIIDRICVMFNAWLRGYFWIIVIETCLYMICFVLFSVPYAPLLALLAGSTILLPFLGPVLSFAVTTGVCLAFADAHMIFTLAGVCVTYIAINGILEQLFLYPSLVGGAIGLTTVETIIVVLLGAMFGGITGMILAVPVTALLKFLIPKMYRSLSAFRKSSGT